MIDEDCCVHYQTCDDSAYKLVMDEYQYINKRHVPLVSVGAKIGNPRSGIP